MGVSFLGVFHNQDLSILGSILGSPYDWKLPSGDVGAQGHRDTQEDLGTDGDV